MSTLVAKVTILRKGAEGALRQVNGSGVFDTWRNSVVVSPGESFVETDAAEIARLVGMGAARLQ